MQRQVTRSQMVSLSKCNRLTMDRTNYPLQLEQNSNEMIFEGKGGPDALDQRQITLRIPKNPPTSGPYCGTFKIEFPQDDEPKEDQLSPLEGAIFINGNEAPFSLQPSGYADKRLWTLTRV